MTRLFLIRHGETEWNRQNKLQGHSDIHLSPEGFHQAITFAEHAPFKHADAIYSSDLVRAMDTAIILAERFNLTIKMMPELREMNYGDWEGRYRKIFHRPGKMSSSSRRNFFGMSSPRDDWHKRNNRQARRSKRHSRFTRRGNSFDTRRGS